MPTRSSLALATVVAVIVACFVRPARSSTLTFKVETAPVFAFPGGGGQQIGTYYTVYAATLPIPTTTLYSQNTGPLPDFNNTPPLNLGYDFYVKTQTGPASVDKQLVINLEGTTNAGSQGGLVDIAVNALKANSSQTAPAGKSRYRDEFRIGFYGMPFASAPTVTTNSRLQDYLLIAGYDPGTSSLPTGLNQWRNVKDDDTFFPIIQTSFTDGELSAFFDFPGSFFESDALEDTALRMVVFYAGDFPSSPSGPGVPEPGTWILLLPAVLLLGAIRARLRAR